MENIEKIKKIEFIFSVIFLRLLLLITWYISIQYHMYIYTVIV